jgi:KDO2-lipid IV(A) lauroyltransferase
VKLAIWAIEGLRAFTKRGWRASRVASLLTAILKLLAPRGKRILSNLSLVYPGSPESWRRDLRRRLYEHLGWTLTEILALQRDPAQSLHWVEETRNRRYIEKPLSQGKGVLFLSGHYGNWELLAAWHVQVLRSGGLDRAPFYAVLRDSKDPDIARLIERYRRNTGIKLLPKSTPVLEMVKLLKSGAQIAILADISWQGGIILPFMGQLCANATGPAALAILASVPIIPVAIYRRGPFRHVVEFFPPILPELENFPDSGEGNAVRKKDWRLRTEFLTREVNSALERLIEPQPELWFWLHNRWK